MTSSKLQEKEKGAVGSSLTKVTNNFFSISLDFENICVHVRVCVWLFNLFSQKKSKICHLFLGVAILTLIASENIWLYLNFLFYYRLTYSVNETVWIPENTNSLSKVINAIILPPSVTK